MHIQHKCVTFECLCHLQFLSVDSVNKMQFKLTLRSNAPIFSSAAQCSFEKKMEETEPCFVFHIAHKYPFGCCAIGIINEAF